MILYRGTLSPKRLTKIESALGFDPGRFNFAWAYYTRHDGLVCSSVMDGLEVASEIPDFRKQLMKVFRTYKPDCVCIERFHSQPGRGSKKNLELVNLMIGMVIEHCMANKIPMELTTASVHKGWLVRTYMNVSKRKDAGRGRIKRRYDIGTFPEWRCLETEHEVDAANMAKFVLEKTFGR